MIMKIRVSYLQNKSVYKTETVVRDEVGEITFKNIFSNCITCLITELKQ